MLLNDQVTLFKKQLAGLFVSAQDPVAKVKKSTHPTPNALPSFIGRLVQTSRQLNKTHGEQKSNSMPEAGNFIYPPIIDNDKISTEVLLSTQIAAKQASNSAFSVSADISKLIKSELVGLSDKVTNNTTLMKELSDIVISFNTTASSGDSSIGSYQYVSISYNILDSLIDKLQADAKVINYKGNEQKISSVGNMLPSELDAYTKSIQKVLNKNPNSTYALIIGVSVLNTSYADAFNCNLSSGDVGNQGRQPIPGSNVSCDTLKSKLDSVLESVTSKHKPPITEITQPLPLTEQEANDSTDKILSAYAAFRNSKYKELRVDGHSGIYAIHYVEIGNE